MVKAAALLRRNLRRRARPEQAKAPPEYVLIPNESSSCGTSGAWLYGEREEDGRPVYVTFVYGPTGGVAFVDFYVVTGEDVNRIPTVLHFVHRLPADEAMEGALP